MIEALEGRRLLSARMSVLVIADHRIDALGQNAPLPNANVWIDYNGNGVLDAREPHTLSGKDGMAVFDSVREGTYTYYAVAPEARGFSAKLKYRTAIQIIETGSSPDRSGANAGYWYKYFDFHIRADLPQYNRCSGVVFFDKDGDGSTKDRLNDTDDASAGARVYLDLNRNGRRDKTDHSTLTNSGGYFEFSNIYQEDLDAPILLGDNVTITSRSNVPSNPAYNGEIGYTAPTPTANLRVTVTLANALTRGFETSDYPVAAELCNVRLFLDLNRNGKRDKKEPQTLRGNESGPPYRLSEFANVYSGKYRLVVVPPPGFSIRKKYVELDLRERSTTNINFTLAGTQRLGIRVFKDANDNGRLDAGELELPLTMPVGLSGPGYDPTSDITFPGLGSSDGRGDPYFDLDIPYGQPGQTLYIDHLPAAYLRIAETYAHIVDGGYRGMYCAPLYLNAGWANDLVVDYPIPTMMLPT